MLHAAVDLSGARLQGAGVTAPEEGRPGLPRREAGRRYWPEKVCPSEPWPPRRGRTPPGEPPAGGEFPVLPAFHSGDPVTDSDDIREDGRQRRDGSRGPRE
ncbi:hypothetical protein GCM10027294_46480 [Marinactinospora endophytica]